MYIVDFEENTIDFYLIKYKFFKKTLRFFHVLKPRRITINKNLDYSMAI